MTTNGSFWREQAALKGIDPSLLPIPPEPKKVTANASQERTGGTRKGRYGAQHTAGVMNGTETRYSDLLELRRLAGEIRAWHFESVRLILAERLSYLPDFMVVLGSGDIEMIDTKGAGPMSDTSLAKIKMAAKQFPCWRFAIERFMAGTWIRREF